VVAEYAEPAPGKRLPLCRNDIDIFLGGYWRIFANAVFIDWWIIECLNCFFTTFCIGQTDD
jgi:hypothetical protein